MASKKKKTEAHDENGSEMMRRFKANPFIFIGTIFILVLVVVAFVMPSSLGLGRGGGSADLTFGYYDKVPIKYVPGNYFAQYYEMVARYRQSTIDSENYSYMGYQIWREAFEAAAVHTAMLQEVKKAGYEAPSKIVDRDVAKLPQFQENGRFSPALYKQLDSNRQLSLWRQVQEDIAKEHFRSDVSGLLTPEAEGEFIGKMASVQRNFDMAVFPVDSYPDEEYAAYAEDNAGLFRSVYLSIISVGSSEKEAKKVLDSITGGETTFEDAARAHSTDGYADRGGDMGIKMVHELLIDIPDEDVRETATALGKDQYSGVLKTSSGWSFFLARDAAQEADMEDPAVMDKVRSYVRNYERGRMENWAIARAEEFIALTNDSGFEEALSQTEIESRSFGPVPVNYGNVDLFVTLSSQSVSEISGAATNEDFWVTAFSTQVETPSRPVVQGGNVLVLFPTAETEAEESAIEGITSTVNGYWLRYMAEQSMYQYFLASPKMKDNFFDVYFRLFMNQGE
jgi:hypothetical protein